MDPHWRLEAAFIAGCCGQAGSMALHERFLSLLPTESNAVELPAAVQSITILSSSKLATFVSKGAQGSMKSAVDLVVNMASGVAPTFHPNPCPLMSKVYSRLPFFCVAEKSKGKTVTKLRGKEAVEHLWENVKARDSQDLSLKDLEQVIVFAWLLPKAEQEAIMDLTKEIYAKAGGVTASSIRKSGAAKSHSASSSSAAAAANHAANAAALCISEAAQMFK
jgi:hypothetical protein